MYMMLKHTHLTAIALSVLFFIVRYIWVMTDSAMMQKKLVKVAPHVIDTVLLSSAIGLCIVLSQYPFSVAWLTEKVIGLVLYIFFGLFALKFGKTKLQKTVAFGLALGVIALMGKLAVSKQPWLF